MITTRATLSYGSELSTTIVAVPETVADKKFLATLRDSIFDASDEPWHWIVDNDGRIMIHPALAESVLNGDHDEAMHILVGS